MARTSHKTNFESTPVVIEKSVYEKIQNGDYTTKLEFPASIKKPRILDIPAGNLTPEQIASLPSIIEETDAAKTAVGNARAAYYADVNRLENQFRTDLESENEMIGHPKAPLLFSKAWEMGHSSGLSEVHNYYVDLLELVK